MQGCVSIVRQKHLGFASIRLHPSATRLPFEANISMTHGFLFSVIPLYHLILRLSSTGSGDTTRRRRAYVAFFPEVILRDYLLSSHPAAWVDHHQPELGHLLDSVPRTFSPGARSFHPAIRHLVNAEGGNIIYYHATDFHFTKGIHNPVDVLGKDSHLETIVTGICHPQGLIKVIIGSNRDDRSKYFFAVHSHFRCCIDNNRGCKQCPIQRP